MRGPLRFWSIVCGAVILGLAAPGHALTPRKYEVYFGYNSCVLTPEGVATVMDFVAYEDVAYRDRYGVELEAHTDSHGSAERNMAVSRCRAEAVAAVLMRLGYDRARIKICARGDSQSLHSNEKTPQERRVYFAPWFMTITSRDDCTRR